MRGNERDDSVTVDEFEVADPADAWVRAGFSVDSDAICRVGGVRIRLAGRGRGTGIVGWSLRGLPSHGSLDDLDGIPTTRSDAVAAMPAGHANGIDATAAYFGDRTAPVKDAVQPGRRITTLRHHELGISVRSAMISAHIRDC
jgi:hypothetical protein